MVVFNGSDEEKLRKAADLGAKFCSIHETISKVAKIDLVVTFESK
jgi:putative redox protein